MLGALNGGSSALAPGTHRLSPSDGQNLPFMTTPRGISGSSGVGPARGFVPAMGRLLAAHSAIGPRVRALFDQSMFQPGAFSRSERERVAAVARDCFY